MLDDVFTKGFVKFHEPGGLDLIKVNEFKLLNTEERNRDNGAQDISPVLAQRLNTFAFYLQQKYIEPKWPKSTFNKFIIWEGVDRDNQGWHTDTFEGYDYFMLYYLDDTFEETGGAIQFKWGSLEHNEQVASFQPKAGDLFLVSNLRGFWHRAVDSKIRRRVVSYDFTISKN